MSIAALNIFQEPRPVTASWCIEDGEKIYLYGVASVTELPYLQVQLPESSLYDVKKMKHNSHVLVCFEIDHSYFRLYTRVVKHIHNKALLVQIEHHEQSKQKRVVSRVSAQGVVADYMPVDDQGAPLRKEKNRAEAVNISKTGILLRTNEIFEPNQRLDLSLTLPEVRLFHCFGRVIRMALQRTGTMESAIQFENMAHANRTRLGNYFTRISK